MTPRQKEILQMLVDGEDIIWNGGRDAYVGASRTSIEMIYRLIRRMWIRQDGQSEPDVYWSITELGRKALAEASAG